MTRGPHLIAHEDRSEMVKRENFHLIRDDVERQRESLGQATKNNLEDF